MSGTSLDGLDLCYTRFSYDKNWDYQIINASTLAYPSFWSVELNKAHLQSSAYVEQLNYRYSVYLNQQIHGFIEENQIKKIDLIASHGHTIWHQPNQNFTKQIGDDTAIAKQLNVPVIVDFRSQDVAMGGQGAPLVPFGDHYLFKEFDACLNFGGFANVSMVQNKQRIAFDICPLNKVLNFYAKQLGKNYDDEGKIAARHSVQWQLLNQLNQLDFYAQKGPKSLGVEFLDNKVFPLLENYQISPEIKIATFSLHIAQQVAKSIKEFDKVLVTGGGAYNTYILSEIQKLVNSHLIVPGKELVEYKEAMIFGFLGLLKYINKNNVFSSVTGAPKNHSAGIIIKS